MTACTEATPSSCVKVTATSTVTASGTRYVVRRQQGATRKRIIWSGAHIGVGVRSLFGPVAILV